MAVILNAPAVYRFTAPACPDRHLEGARCLGAKVRDATPEDAGEILADTLLKFMRETHFPNGLGAVGFSAADVDALVEGVLPQQRVIRNAPKEATREDLAALYHAALSYW
jgi:alcohol dehydrogenase class IV